MPLSASAKLAASRARDQFTGQQLLPSAPSAFSSLISKAGFALFSNDSFWLNSSLHSLWLLLSSSKEVRKEIFSYKDLTKIVEVLLKDRTITIGNAMDRFALTMPIISSFCSKLPDKYTFIFFQNNVMKHKSIDFHDAFKMAMERKGGLQAVVKLRERSKAIADKAAQKKWAEADQLHAACKKECKTMSHRVKASMGALKEEKGNLDDFRYRLYTLKSVYDLLFRTKGIVNWLRFVLDSQELKMDNKVVKEACKSVRHAVQKATARFNASASMGKYERIAL